MKKLFQAISQSQDTLLFVIHQHTGETTPQWFLVQVDLEISEELAMIDYGVYNCKWYIRNFEDCTLAPIAECRLWAQIRELKWDGTIGKILSVAPQKMTKSLE